jgi:hypothetical protein
MAYGQKNTAENGTTYTTPSSVVTLLGGDKRHLWLTHTLALNNDSETKGHTTTITWKNNQGIDITFVSM